MRRHEAVTLLTLGILLLVAGIGWLAGPWGMVGAGAALVLCGLFFDFTDDENTRGEGGR